MKPGRPNSLYPATKTTATLQGIPSGPAGVRATLNMMRHYARQAKKDIHIRELAMSLVRHERPKNWSGEISRLYEFVRDQIRYVRDINGIETLATPVKTLEFGQGDCDDKATLLAALLESIGHPARFRAVGFAPNKFSHVLVETKIGNRWVALETTEPVNMGWTPPGAIASMVVNV